MSTTRSIRPSGLEILGFVCRITREQGLLSRVLQPTGLPRSILHPSSQRCNIGVDVRFGGVMSGGRVTDGGRRLPLVIFMRERLLDAVGHSKAAILFSAS